MEKICIVIPYFGTPRGSFPLFLESCKRNPTIDWLFAVDFDFDFEKSDNIKVLKTTLQDVEKRARERVFAESRLERPYKLCDYKTFYGHIFEDELQGYDGWGFGDTDVIYGDIRTFFDNIDHNQYEKINWWGHLCLMRNVPKVSQFCLTLENGLLNYKTVLTEQANLGFDEHDFNEIVIKNGGRIYTGAWSADIDCFYKRMRVVDMATITQLCKVRKPEWAPKNYRKQLFVSLKGRTYRYYYVNGKIKRDEFAYIHFRKECPIYLPALDTDSFIISRSGFYPLDEENLCDKDSFLEMVRKYNMQEDFLKETMRFVYYWIKYNLKGEK